MRSSATTRARVRSSSPQPRGQAQKLVRVIVAMVALAAPAAGQEPPGRPDPGPVTWSRLRFKGEKFFLTAYSEVRLATVPAAEVAPALIPSPRSVPVAPAGPDLLRLTLDSSGSVDQSRNEVWLNPSDLSALQRDKHRFGQKPYRKIYRFTADGIYSLRTAPASREETRLPPAAWTKVEEFFYPHPAGADCPVVSEPAVVFYLVAAAPVAGGGEPRRLCVFSRRAVIGVEIVTAGREPLIVDYAASSPRGKSRHQGEITATKLTVRAHPLGGDGGKPDFRLLGLEGDVEVYLDPLTRIPVQVSGRIAILGRVDVRLIEADLTGN